MASSLVLRRITNMISPIRSVAVAPRFFGSQVATVDEDDRRVDSDRRSRSGRPPVNRHSAGSPAFFSDPFSATRSLNQMLNLVDQLMMDGVNPINAAMSPRRGWDVREDKDVLHLRMDMPGVDKENVKISVEKDTLIIKGEGEKDEDEEQGRRYSSRLDLPEKVYKVGEIKAEMKNGVLKIKVPKVKDEDRNDVFEVKID